MESGEWGEKRDPSCIWHPESGIRRLASSISRTVHWRQLDFRTCIREAEK